MDSSHKDEEEELMLMMKLRRPETLDLILLENGQSAFFWFKAFQISFKCHFYTLLMR